MENDLLVVKRSDLEDLIREYRLRVPMGGSHCIKYEKLVGYTNDAYNQALIDVSKGSVSALVDGVGHICVEYEYFKRLKKPTL